ncbi:MAG: diaminopimelate decarboxylase [Acidobacteriota bacterium]|jgi:diaminopimelate decarboxylase|nr:diaminopimelate decarboxylase [Acidobacteriota bacterium]
MGEPFLDYSGGVLRMEGVPLAELAERLGTPFFLMSESRLRANYQALERGLAAAGPGTILRYCAKTNREGAVLETMSALGSHLLASHAAEAALAIRCGFPPERIAYARPVLTPEELDAAVELGVPLFHIHHPDDLAQLEAAAARAGRPVRVSFRLRGKAGLSPLGRLNRRLGLDEDEIVEAARKAVASPWLEPEALNFYLGTQQASLDGFTRVFRRVLDLLKRLPTLREVNLGGGIPSPTLKRVGPRQVIGRLRDRLASSPTGNLEAFAAQLGARFRDLVDADLPILAAEPGRAIVGDAAVLVTRVRAIRGSWLFLDASRNHLPESPLFFTRRILPLSEGKGAERFWNLSGCTLNTLDVLDMHRRLPMLAPGDGIAFCDAGAYSISRASSYAGLSPAVYLLEAAGTVRLVRRAAGVEDL